MRAAGRRPSFYSSASPSPEGTLRNTLYVAKPAAAATITAARSARAREGWSPCARSATAGTAALTAVAVAATGPYFFARSTARWSWALVMLERPSILSRFARA